MDADKNDSEPGGFSDSVPSTNADGLSNENRPLIPRSEAIDNSLPEAPSHFVLPGNELPFALQPSSALPPRWKRRQRLCIYLFLATCLSTFLIGSNLFPAMMFQSGREFIAATGIWNMSLEGLKYSVPLMVILVCHEMGHYLQARRYGVPATLPFFIPMPMWPLGTMGAVIVQGAGVANRRAMFDIAVSGPLAGLVIALPVMYYGVTEATYVTFDVSQGGIEFGEPLLLQWMIHAVHGPQPEGMMASTPSLMFAGWVGVLITALNLIPVGQLDGGHILYTLIGRKAHYVAYLALAAGFSYIIYSGYPGYVLLFVLILLMGPKHPPTSDDSVPLGWQRHVIGWLTLAFIIIGFTLRPIEFHEPEKKETDDAELVVQQAANDVTPVTLPPLRARISGFRLPLRSSPNEIEA